MERKTLSLDGRWELAFAPDTQVQGWNALPVSGADLHRLSVSTVAATVPGNVELDLQRAGLIEDPYFGENILKAAQREIDHYWYVKEFDLPADDAPFQLVLEGIDTFADLYIDGEKLGETDNMLIPHRFSLPPLSPGKHELFIHIRPTALEARRYPSTPADGANRYNLASLRVRKAPHMFGWDIFPRLLSAGLWRSVRLETLPENRIEETYVYTQKLAENGDAAMCLYYRHALAEADIGRYSLRIEGACGDSRFSAEDRLWFNAGSLRFTIPSAALWWVRERGAQNLYSATVTLLLDGQPVSEKKLRFGVRTVHLDYAPMTKSSAGEFCFVLNGERVFVRGTNWVPADALHSRDRERIPRMLALAEEMHCNTLRIWGGSVYEDDAFFDLCDEKGFLVWQDFAMGCAAYPQDDEFAGRLEQEVRTVVKSLRQHPSLFLWAGDNECDVAAYDGWWGNPSDPQKNRLTREIIPRVLQAEDPRRPYLPSSPFVDPACLEDGGISLVENHLWGPRDYYKGEYYADAPAKFASETGYHGCVSPTSAARFISKKALWPPLENPEWILHASSPERGTDSPYAYRIPLMWRQVEGLFGAVPDDPDRFAMASQLSQAEAMKFFVERFRMAKWNRTGIIWWNLIDGWPQFSDAVVDYYFKRKQAYFHILRAQQPVCFMCSEAENGVRRVMAVNDLREAQDCRFTVTDLESGRTVCTGQVTVPGDSALPVASIDASAEKQGLYILEWDCAAGAGRNHYLYGTPTFSLEDCLRWFNEAGLWEADWD